MRIRYKACLLSCILITALMGGCAKKEPAAGTAGHTAQENEDEDKAAENPATQETETPSDAGPEDTILFEAQTLDGATITEALFSESRITMVNVWATYCNPCLREMPGLGEIASAYDPGDFQLIGIISDVMEDSDEKALQKAFDLVEQTSADYPHLLLNESLYYSLLTEVSAVPTTFFVNQDGQILDTVIGSMEKSAWEEQINALLE